MDGARVAHLFRPIPQVASRRPSLDGDTKSRNVGKGGASTRPGAHPASIEMKERNGWSAGATFEGEFSDLTNYHAGRDVLRYQWCVGFRFWH